MYLNIVEQFDCLLQDLGIDKVSRNYLLNRLKCEKVKFLSVTLPGLWKTVLFSIERGFFNYEDCTSFARKKKLPAVMHGLFSKIFDNKGFLLLSPCENALLAIRQVCEYWYKCAFTFSNKEKEIAEEKFLSHEISLADESSLDLNFIDKCRKNFVSYYKPLVNAKLSDVLSNNRPRFGPGSFASSQMFKKLHNEDYQALKRSRSTLLGTCRRDQKAFSGFFKAYPSSKEEILFTDEGKTSEVLFVPKDSRGPRIISREPLHLLKMQMSFLDWSTRLLEDVTNHRINFVDQNINRELARKASIDGTYATNDLKEASDTIRYGVARTIYGDSPVFRYFLTKMRSTHSRLPSGKTIRLRKLSGMGSGLTFPILALTIHIAVSTAISVRHGLRYEDAMREVFVYGDDLIVPSKYNDVVDSALSRVGLKLNVDKSFSKGPFRESCGGDYIHGHEVSPVRLRLGSVENMPEVSTLSRDLTLSINGPTAILALERHSRELVKAGLNKTAEFYYRHIENALKTKLPLVAGSVPFIGRYTLVQNDVYMQKMQRKVFQPIAVQASINTPCPYKFLGTKLRRESDTAPNSKISRSSELISILLSDKQVKSRDLAWTDGTTPGETFGTYNKRYACSMSVVNNVEAWRLSSAP